MIRAHSVVMLGTTKPEARSDGREFVCSAAYQSDLGLIRIYPLARWHTPRRWSRHAVRLQRNSKDPRRESWQLAADRSIEHHPWINDDAFQWDGDPVDPKYRGDLIHDRYFHPSIQSANEKRVSLALIRPQSAEVIWTEPDRRDDLDMHQLELITPEDAGGVAPQAIPRLRFHDEGGEHRLQLRDWGVYELIRKRGIDYAVDNTAAALHLGPDSTLLVGNVLRHQTSWLVIAVLNLHTDQLSLPLDQSELAATA